MALAGTRRSISRKKILRPPFAFVFGSVYRMVIAMALARRLAPFDHRDWIFELKCDGFRSLAITEHGRCQLISRNGHPFNSSQSFRKGWPCLATGRPYSTAKLSVWTKEADYSFATCSFIVVSRASWGSIC
jgi:hypothetical protein